MQRYRYLFRPLYRYRYQFTLLYRCWYQFTLLYRYRYEFTLLYRCRYGFILLFRYRYQFTLLYRYRYQLTPLILCCVFFRRKLLMTWRRTWMWRSLSPRCSWWPSLTCTTCSPPSTSTCWPTASSSSPGSRTIPRQPVSSSSTPHWCAQSPAACYRRLFYSYKMRTVMLVWCLLLKVNWTIEKKFFNISVHVHVIQVFCLGDLFSVLKLYCLYLDHTCLQIYMIMIVYICVHDCIIFFCYHREMCILDGI